MFAFIGFASILSRLRFSLMFPFLFPFWKALVLTHGLNGIWFSPSFSFSIIVSMFHSLYFCIYWFC